MESSGVWGRWILYDIFFYQFLLSALIVVISRVLNADHHVHIQIIHQV